MSPLRDLDCSEGGSSNRSRRRSGVHIRTAPVEQPGFHLSRTADKAAMGSCCLTESPDVQVHLVGNISQRGAEQQEAISLTT